MTGQNRLFSLIAILMVTSIVIVGVALALLYDSAFEQQRARLIDTVNSQAGLIVAVARYNQNIAPDMLDENPDYDAFEATISQLKEAHDFHDGIGETGEFTLARREGDQIVFLLNHRHHDLDAFHAVSITSPDAEPMKRALRGESGTVIGRDYRGEQVLVAYESVAELDLGIVAKIDISEIRAPFIRAGTICAMISLMLVFLAVILSLRIGNPMVRDLIEKEAQLRDITTTMPGSVFQFVLHQDGSFAMPYMAEAFERMTGIQRGILMEDAGRMYDYIHPDEHAAFSESIKQSAESMTQWDKQFRVVTPDRGTIWISGRSNPSLTADGSILWNGVLTDITERKRSEEALRTSEEQHRRLFEHSNDPIFVHSLQGDILDVNSRACEMLGYSRDQLLSMKLPELHTEGEMARCAEAVETTKREGSTVFESLFKTADGSVLNVSISSKEVDSQRGIIQRIVRDITETKRLQELESRAGRLETAGIIAGQVAHDFNNLLAPLMAYPDIIREELPRDHPALQYLDQIEMASQKIAEINQDLLAMGRRGHYNKAVLNLNTVVRDALLDLEFSETVIRVTELCDDLMDILGGGAQLHRMISNLLHNAKDAIEERGQITIRTENYYVDDVSVVYGRVPIGEYVKLTISDTGCGIPDNIVQKIFDPFFTSKTTDKKRGSGLGMSVVDAVVKDHGGFLDLKTQTGVGTSFYLYFPVTRQPKEDLPAENIPCGTETVLVVDDDEIQRSVSSDILKRLGYEVTTADSGERAIELLRENAYELLVLDMIMPSGIDGTETYRRALEIRPDQKAIILSGFSESHRVLEARALGAVAFVRKPLTRKVMAMAVREELDRPVKVLA